MNAIITDKPTLDPAKKKQLDEYVIKDAVKSVSAVTVFELIRLSSLRKSKQLVSYTYSKHRYAALDKLLDLSWLAAEYTYRRKITDTQWTTTRYPRAQR